MAFANVNDALAQYAAALPWQQSLASAQSALDAVRYLLVARLQHLGDAQTTMSYETLESEKKALEKFLGATAPRSHGRSRRSGIAFRQGGIA
jgi:hypothetical protein